MKRHGQYQARGVGWLFEYGDHISHGHEDEESSPKSANADSPPPKGDEVAGFGSPVLACCVERRKGISSAVGMRACPPGTECGADSNLGDLVEVMPPHEPSRPSVPPLALRRARCAKFGCLRFGPCVALLRRSCNGEDMPPSSYPIGRSADSGYAMVAAKAHGKRSGLFIPLWRGQVTRVRVTRGRTLDFRNLRNRPWGITQ